MKVGELYYELGIEDQTDRDLKAAQRRLARFERDAATTVELDADGSKIDREVRRADGLFAGMRRSGETPVTPGMDLDPMMSEADTGGGRLADSIGGWASAGALAAAAVGVAVGKKLVDSFEGYLDREAQGDKLAAQLGLNDWEAAYYGKRAAAIYKDNWGESIGNVNEAIRAGRRSGLIDADSTGEEIDKVARHLLLLQDVFDQDLSMSAQGVGKLISTGLVSNTDEAFDLIVKGLQGTTGMSDDLLETFQEYSTLFRALGLSGPQALGLIQQGLKGGARDADTVADALKEAQIRMSDGSVASAEGYRTLGLDAKKYTAMAAKGGDDAAVALDDVLDALRRTDDPVKRNAAAVALFGTKAEDLGAALFAMDPETAAKGLGDLGGAAEDAGNKVGDNLAGKWETWKRSAEIGVQDYLGSLVAAYDEGGLDGLAEKLGEDLDGLGDLWDEHGPKFIDALSTWWDEHGQPLAVDVMKEVGGAAGEALIDGVWNHLKDPKSWAKVASPLPDEVVIEWTAQMADWVKDVPGEIGRNAVGMWDGIYEAFTDTLNDLIGAWNDLEFTLPTIEVFGKALPGSGKTFGTPQLPEFEYTPTKKPKDIGIFNDLPFFHRGGTVPGPAGADVLAVVQAGERVRTREQEQDLWRNIRAMTRRGGRDAPLIGTVNAPGMNPKTLAAYLDRKTFG